ncbi:MAG: VTT domain-containing protein, partial [Pararhodobacter sp.]|nr:VTT domain-containing protein [Pararhodobacter sp.]
HPVQTPALFMLGYVVIVAFSLPGATVATLTGGFLFGVFPGVVFNVVAATLGAVAIFLAVRVGLGEGLRRRIDASDGAVRRLTDGIRANEVPVLLTMRLVPAVPFFIANLIPAFLGVATWRFAWTTLVGTLPGGLVYTWVGSGLGAVFARGEAPDLGILFEPHILGPILGLAALSLLPVVLKTLRRT